MGRKLWIDGSLHLALYPRPVEQTGLEPEAVMGRKVDRLQLEVALAGAVSHDHMAHVVIEVL